MGRAPITECVWGNQMDWAGCDPADLEDKVCPGCDEGDHRKHDYYWEDEGGNRYYCDCPCMGVHDNG